MITKLFTVMIFSAVFHAEAIDIYYNALDCNEMRGTWYIHFSYLGINQDCVIPPVPVEIQPKNYVVRRGYSL